MEKRDSKNRCWKQLATEGTMGEYGGGEEHLKASQAFPKCAGSIYEFAGVTFASSWGMTDELEGNCAERQVDQLA